MHYFFFKKTIIYALFIQWFNLQLSDDTLDTAFLLCILFGLMFTLKLAYCVLVSCEKILYGAFFLLILERALVSFAMLLLLSIEIASPSSDVLHNDGSESVVCLPLSWRLTIHKACIISNIRLQETFSRSKSCLKGFLKIMSNKY